MENMKKKYSSPKLQAYGNIEQITRVGNITNFSGAGSWGDLGNWNWDFHQGDRNGKNDFSG
ncbi:MAG: hypothetical protein BMS9Abin05_0237 [Rhodothermia bacterium]|nr:MAG: hypothetical protein BMS9Abin05_0237 [Rhodothermia bacterium]